MKRIMFEGCGPVYEWTQKLYRVNNSFNIKLNTYVHKGIVMACGHYDWEDCEIAKGCEVMKYTGQPLNKVYRDKGWKLSDHS